MIIIENHSQQSETRESVCKRPVRKFRMNKGKPKGKPIWVYLVTRLKAIRKQDSVIVKVGLG